LLQTISEVSIKIKSKEFSEALNKFLEEDEIKIVNREIEITNAEIEE